MHNLERQRDNGNFDKLEAEFGLLVPAIATLEGAIRFEDANGITKCIEKDSSFGKLIFSERALEDAVEHTAILVDSNNYKRGFSFINGEINDFFGYSVYVSNQEIERFLTGFASEMSPQGKA